MAGWIAFDADGVAIRMPFPPEGVETALVLIACGAALAFLLWGLHHLPTRDAFARDASRLRRRAARRYVALVFLAAAAVVVWALWIGLWRAPLLVDDLLQDLGASRGDLERTRSNIVAMTAMLGGIGIIGAVVVGAIRVWINERTARTAEENLTTGLINKAVEGLGAEKQVDTFWRVVRFRHDGGEDSTLELRGEAAALPAGVEVTSRGDWEAGSRSVPNIEVRLGAIYALERIAQDSDRDHIRVMEILCAYVRENAPASAAAEHDLGEWPDRPQAMTEAERAARDAARRERAERLSRWTRGLARPRTDIQAAIEVIGRRSRRQMDIERMQRSRQSDEPYRLDLRETNLRRADLSDLDLARAKFHGARLEGANLRGARLEGADLMLARLEGADLMLARLEGANLGEARLEGADLRGARLEGANLRGARLEGADLGGARLEGADLRGARLEGADLRGARLEGANLRGARLEGADLREADFRNSNWAGASNRASPAQFADLRGCRGLTQAQLDHFIGNAETLLPERVNENGEPWHVWSCWETPPEGFDALVARLAGPLADDAGRAELRRAFLCGPGKPRAWTGTPWPLDRPRPEGHPLGP